MAKFAGYGFNKSHSAAYSLLAYHTAWLKTHYPVEFMAALLTSETSKPENVVKYIGECRELDIAVVPPDVQVSAANFTPTGDSILFGLAAIKNVGHNAIDSIITARAELAGSREARLLFPLRVLRKDRPPPHEQARPRTPLQGRRAGLLRPPRPRLRRPRQSHRARPEIPDATQPPASTASSACSTTPAPPPPPATTTLSHPHPTGTSTLRLQNEKEVLGFFVSGHPLDKYREKLRNLKVVDTATACEMKPEPATFNRGRREEPPTKSRSPASSPASRSPSPNAPARCTPRPRSKTPSARSSSSPSPPPTKS